MTVDDIRLRFEDTVRARLGATALRRVAALGVVLVVVGGCAPWAGFAGFPGKMTLPLWYAFPGGARLFVLVLTLGFALVVLRDLPGRRSAATRAGWGSLLVTAVTLLAIAADGGGVAGVAWGGWVTVAGGLLLVTTAPAVPDRPPSAWAPRSPAAAVALLTFTVAAILAAVVYGLGIAESSLFIGFVLFVAFLVAVLAALGVVEGVRQVAARHHVTALALAFLAAVAFPFTQGGDAYYLRIAASIGVFAVTALGLNIVVGLAGLLDLGYVAFFGVGAYVGALFANATFTTVHVHLPFPLVLVLGACIAAVFGVVIGAPTLRLRGDYLAIVTLGFGEIFRITANNLDGQAGPDVTRGPNGIAGVPDLRLLGFDFGESHTVLGVPLPGFANYYFLELALLVLVVAVFVRLNDSRIGRGWVAIREDEVAATAMGINTFRLKLLAFAIGAFLAGAAGTVNAHVARQVSPDSYTFLESIFLLAAVVLGGMGTVAGPLLGMTTLLLLPEKLRFFAEQRLLIFGLLLVLMMRFRPEGIIANRRRQREFHEEHGGDALAAPPGSPVAGAHL